ncbi:MAG: AMP-binding protein [Gammaproteobacteria bacterium]|nr:AMP-binding protein [Gammaproteobacteria bacterium]
MQHLYLYLMKNNPIYNAQCFGNVEPIEYMVPYPNLRSLVVGQCIKFSNNILYKDIGITNSVFYKSINKAANWLLTKGIKNKDKVFVTNIPSPMMEILSYAIWSIGAVLVIANEKEIDNAINKTKAKLIISEITEEDKSIIEQQSEDYIEISSTLLLNEAVIYFNNKNGIRLSHYNLLINTYGVQRHLNIFHKDILNIDVPQNTSAGIVLKTILPLYTGTSVSDKSANINFSTKSNADYQVKFDWNNLIDTNPQCLYILPEATAILAIGSTPNHLTSIVEEKKSLKIKGHSVMMGYLDDKENTKVFKSGSLLILK